MAAIPKIYFYFQLPIYWMAQYLGAFLAASVVYGNYYEAMVHYSSDSTATSSEAFKIFASYPNGQYNPSNTTLAMDQVNMVIAKVLCVCLCVCAFKDLINMFFKYWWH
jgi:glycerol uptake facilitator-like aquaporin